MEAKAHCQTYVIEHIETDLFDFELSE